MKIEAKRAPYLHEKVPGLRARDATGTNSDQPALTFPEPLLNFLHYTCEVRA